MLSLILLRFLDSDLQKCYQFEKIEFYKKAIPIITLVGFMQAILIDGLFRANELEDIHTATSIVNWVFFAVLLVSSVMIWFQFYKVSFFVCPLLTMITFYYYTF